MNKRLNLTYASSLTNLCEVNSSFDTGILRICYTGENRNKSFISKETITKSIPTLYNCPIVCNYDRETDTLGGHDIEVVCDSDGILRMVDVTTPIGVIPESAKVWFGDYEEDDGTVHEYLYAEVLLWKRQEAYKKIKNDGITAHSMEIKVKSGRSVNGIYHVDDFEFNAFTLIGVDPCFEGSALEVFSRKNFEQQMSEMMQDLKDAFTMVNHSKEYDNIHQQHYSMKGGEKILKDNMKNNDNKKFALTNNIVEEIIRVLTAEKITYDWGEYPRYCYADCDIEAAEVYCWDRNDWLLYGFKFSLDGDSVSIDFESKKRKKYVIADFDGGEQASPITEVFELMENKLKEYKEFEAKFNANANTITSMTAELQELRQFKLDTENAAAKSQREAVFAKFSDLTGTEAFEALRENCMNYDLETLEEKCFAIRGRNGVVSKFSLETKAPKLKIEKTDISNEPYGGLFVKYAKNGSN